MFLVNAVPTRLQNARQHRVMSAPESISDQAFGRESFRASSKLADIGYHRAIAVTAQRILTYLA